MRDHDYVIGEFIWTGIDYLGESGSFPAPRQRVPVSSTSPAGKKPGFYQRAAYWRDDPVLQLFVLTGEKPELAWRAAPARLANGTGRRTPSSPSGPPPIATKSSCSSTIVPSDAMRSRTMSTPATGPCPTLRECSRRSVIAPASRSPRSELRTAGAPARLQITPLPSPIASDLAFYEITVVDEAGLTVPDATPAVTVRVEGAGRLIGLDTGDLNYGGLFKTDTRNAYQGRLLATVQRTAPAGEIRVTAFSPELSNRRGTGQVNAGKMPVPQARLLSIIGAS